MLACSIAAGLGALRSPAPSRQGIAVPASEAPSRMKDEALVGQTARGDHDAFAALYDRHSALVYGIARRMLGDGPQAEDIAQSVFLQVWVRPDAFRGGNFGAWLARVTRNACLDVLRSSAVRLRESELPEDLSSDLRVDDEVFARFRVENVTAALAAIPEEQRIAIEKAYFEGLSYREVAERIGAPLGTVKSRIRIGLRRLWEALRQEVPT